eukprot:m.305369 g.305369  ORF g.305369 m.305369 type:complete len:71 (-) comp20179_c0_seq4:249-461(-)
MFFSANLLSLPHASQRDGGAITCEPTALVLVVTLVILSAVLAFTLGCLLYYTIKQRRILRCNRHVRMFAL